MNAIALNPIYPGIPVFIGLAKDTEGSFVTPLFARQSGEKVHIYSLFSLRDNKDSDKLNEEAAEWWWSDSDKGLFQGAAKLLLYKRDQAQVDYRLSSRTGKITTNSGKTIAIRYDNSFFATCKVTGMRPTGSRARPKITTAPTR
jgi:hypothetical protein